MRENDGQRTIGSRRIHGWVVLIIWIGLVLTGVAGCGSEEPAATVDGTLTLGGRPLDNCLVTFLPEAKQDGAPGPHSTGLTDGQGCYRLRCADQREGAAVGPHRVTVQDLSVSTGVRRRDHGTIDMEQNDDKPSPPVRRSRISKEYVSPASTPFHFEVKPGHQTIDLEIR